MSAMTIRCTAHSGAAQGIDCKYCAEIIKLLQEGQELRAEAIVTGDPEAHCIEIVAA